MTKRNKQDPGRALLDLLHTHSKNAVKQFGPQLDTGEVLNPDDPSDGLVVQLDNMQTPITDCVVIDSVTAVNGLLAGDRVLVLYQQELAYVIGTIGS